MSSSYPSGLDSYPTLIDNIDAATASHQNDRGDAIIALETKVGVNSSAVTTSIDYFLNNGSGTFKTHSHDGTGTTLLAVVPPGGVMPYAGTSAPTGWLFCDGSAVSRSTYATLFAIVGVVYGAGNGTSTFNVPDLRGKFPLGKATSGPGSTIGETGGTLDHTHSETAHTHSAGSLTSASHSHSLPIGVQTANQINISAVYGTGETQTLTNSQALNADSDSVSVLMTKSEGGGSIAGSTASGTGTTTGTNNPPFIALNYIIRT